MAELKVLVDRVDGSVEKLLALSAKFEVTHKDMKAGSDVTADVAALAASIREEEKVLEAVKFELAGVVDYAVEPPASGAPEAPPAEPAPESPAPEESPAG
jgi:hypothetical protein